ncbi:MAG TPA: hypothetical protein VHB53_14520 [Solirubrobacterales bacterium]|nr:hypothetical protein [Solirubrobacterales bacterium]
MKGLLARRPSPALIVALIALVCALTGTAWAALGKNSVGTKQLKNGAVSTAKIKKEAVTAKKVKKHSLTGADINFKKLGTVPSAASATNATNAVNAQNATNAQNAVNAKSAGTADALSPLEAVHFVGTPGQPPFVEGSNLSAEEETGISGVNLRSVGFYKDHEGIVHLEGVALVKHSEYFGVVFTLPPGFRPAAKTALTFPDVEEEGTIAVVGSGISYEGHDYSGDVVLVAGGTEGTASLNGITFRAEG